MTTAPAWPQSVFSFDHVLSSPNMHTQNKYMFSMQRCKYPLCKVAKYVYFRYADIEICTDAKYVYFRYAYTQHACYKYALCVLLVNGVGLKVPLLDSGRNLRMTNFPSCESSLLIALCAQLIVLVYCAVDQLSVASRLRFQQSRLFKLVS